MKHRQRIKFNLYILTNFKMIIRDDSMEVLIIIAKGIEKYECDNHIVIQERL